MTSMLDFERFMRILSITVVVDVDIDLIRSDIVHRRLNVTQRVYFVLSILVVLRQVLSELSALTQVFSSAKYIKDCKWNDKQFDIFKNTYGSIFISIQNKMNHE
jgi:hypothetical protein